MYCRNCAHQIAEQAVVCVSCGLPPAAANKFCQNCGAETNPAAEVCTKCGVRLFSTAPGSQLKSKLAAGLLGVFLGGLGIHRFYLGYTGIGVAQLCTTVFLGILTCGIALWVGPLWGFIEGILILTGNINKDASGRPLTE
jgi:TM2 domain-containing membrane protein YozV/RNA polymerase subunit RPABC4/transcription elongation factor Spt4